VSGFQPFALPFSFFFFFFFERKSLIMATGPLRVTKFQEHHQRQAVAVDSVKKVEQGRLVEQLRH